MKFLIAIKDNKRVKLETPDNQYAKKLKMKDEQTKTEQERATLVKKGLKNSNIKHLSSSESEANQDCDSSSSEASISKILVKKMQSDQRKTLKNNQTTDTENKVQLLLPKNPFLNPNICQTADRLNLSLGQRAAFLGAIAKEGGASCSSVTLSKTSSYNASKYNRQAIAKNIKSDFNKPDFLTIHRDGKIIEGDGERLAVLVAGAPNYVEGKLLGIPKIMNGTGLVQAETSFDLIKDWELNKSIIGMVFDTTASNSGWKNGASVILEKKLNSKLFYLPCRHHIFEIILSSVWKHLFGPTTGPTNIEFLKLKNSWDTIPQKNDNFKLLDINEHSLKST